MNGSAAEFVPRRPSSALSFTPNAAALPFMMPGLVLDVSTVDAHVRQRFGTVSHLIMLNGRPRADVCCRHPVRMVNQVTPTPPLCIASRRC